MAAQDLPARPDRPYPPAILVMGPTASGKTALALALARELPCEIVSVDSALVYRGMDVGTAKPDRAAREAVPHHLIDIREPHEAYSAARFRADALDAMSGITARGRIPLLAGGTMLYFRALLEGLNELPEAHPGVRAEILRLAQRRGWPALHEELAGVDPEIASRLHPHDAQRIQRALEIYRITGRTMGELLRSERAADFPYAPIRIGLAPAERAVLHQRIEARFDAMLEAGLVEEVAELRARCGLNVRLPALRCVGYRQIAEYLEGGVSFETMRSRGIAATRQLAKRQLTWLRAMRGVALYDCLDPRVAERVLEHVRREL
jgi:tRNA dimethylallyltransferase